MRKRVTDRTTLQTDIKHALTCTKSFSSLVNCPSLVWTNTVPNINPIQLFYALSSTVP